MTTAQRKSIYRSPGLTPAVLDGLPYRYPDSRYPIPGIRNNKCRSPGLTQRKSICRSPELTPAQRKSTCRSPVMKLITLCNYVPSLLSHVHDTGVPRFLYTLCLLRRHRNFSAIVPAGPYKMVYSYEALTPPPAYICQYNFVHNFAGTLDTAFFIWPPRVKQYD